MTYNGREIISRWVEANPDGYLNLTYREIAKECGISESYISKCLPEIIADRDGILPSDVLKQRVEAGRHVGRKGLHISDDTLAQIYKYADDAMPIRDIAYLTSISHISIRKCLKQRKQS